MKDTKQRILAASLELFAEDGYEAVSVSRIAERLGITKGALYKHFRNKRDIFDSILVQMRQRDAEGAAEYDLPEDSSGKMPEKYGSVRVRDLVEYSKAQFRYWTEDDFARCFRRMLTLEQFRSPEMSRVYGQYLVSGPLNYVADIFSGLGLPDPETLAAELYAPMFFYFSMYDGAEDKRAVISAVDEYLDGFLRRICRGGQNS